MIRVFALLFGLTLLFAPIPATATPLNQWQVSCGADAGSVVKRGREWRFKTSSNHCPGGIFKQRAEIFSKPIRPTDKGSYLFSTLLAMSGGAGNKFSIFQIHDGRLGCAPPLKVTVLKSGYLELTSDIKLGEGENCKRGQLNLSRSPNRFVSDGKPHELKVLIDFDGKGNFDATVWLDGKVQANGRYEIAGQNNKFKPQKYYFKHGVYSQFQFPYEMISSGMRVSRVRLMN